jgi:feruloyl esterase
MRKALRTTVAVAALLVSSLSAAPPAYAQENRDARGGWDWNGPWDYRGQHRDTTPRDTPDFAQRCAEAGDLRLRIPVGQRLDRVTMVGSELRGAGTTNEHCAITFDFVADASQRWVHRATHFLPKVWRGRFMHLGGGGTNPGYSPNAAASYLERGFAHATFDNALAINGEDLLWMDGNVNDSADAVFSRDGIHLSTIIGKQLLRAVYGRPAAYNYYSGCSTGGNMGIQAALYHPLTFDGIQIGAPAHYGQAQHVDGVLYQKHIRPGSTSTLAFPPGPTTAAIAAEVLRRCDGLDGVMDGIVDRPEQCIVTADQVADAVGLNDADRDVLNYHWREAGERLRAHTRRGTFDVPFYEYPQVVQLPGVNLGAPFLLPSFWGAMDPSWDPADNGDVALWRPAFLAHDFYAQASINQVGEIWAGELGGKHFRDLRAFGSRGGKIIIWHTWPDPLLSIYGSTDLVRHLQRASMGNSEDRYMRFYTKTTGGHCAINTVVAEEAVINWVENRRIGNSLPLDAPASNRPACEYPLMPKLRDAAADSWTCIDPNPRRRGQWFDWWKEDDPRPRLLRRRGR